MKKTNRIITALTYLLPFLVAVFSVVTLYQANADRLYPGTMVSPFIFSLCVAALFLLLAWLCRWTAKAAPLAAAGFTWGILLWYTTDWTISILILFFSFCIAAYYKERTKAISFILCIILIVGTIASGVQGYITNSHKLNNPIESSYTKDPGQPNIYFIVPDRMPSPLAMRESGLDPAAFVETLQDLGFYVPDDKMSADAYTIDYKDKVYTTRTMRFFASELNGGIDIPLDIGYQDCRSMIKDNEIFTRLHNNGYQVFNYASWFTETKKFTAADKNFRYGDVNILERFVQNELGEAYLNRTILHGLSLRTLFNSYGLEKRRHVWQSNNILDFANSGYTSTFVISHIMLPHEPYVYAESGMNTQEQYYANINYAMGYIQTIAERIRAADPTAIVIIQSDEGMAYSKPPKLNEDLSPAQWSGVFTAWYLPEEKIETSEDKSTWYYLASQDKINLSELPHTDILNIVVESK